MANVHLTDRQWAFIQPFLPSPARTGQPRSDDRRPVAGILYVLTTGCRWQDLPRDYGAPTTVWRRLKRWGEAGIWELSERPVVRWEMAVPQGESLSSLEPGYAYGYPVDAGTGCFMDVDAARGLLAETAAQRDAGDVLLDLLDETRVHTWSWADLVTHDTTGASVIAFSSGWGDGFYASYWGHDTSNQRVALVTDFGVLDESWLAD